MTKLEKILITAGMLLVSISLQGCAVEIGNPLSSNEEDDKAKVNDTKADTNNNEGSLQLTLANIMIDKQIPNSSDNYSTQDQTDDSYQGQTEITQDNLRLNISKIYLLRKKGN